MSFQKKPIRWKKWIAQLLLFTLIVLGGYALGSVLGRTAVERSSAGSWSLPGVLLTALVTIYLVLLIHELGHLTAGRLAGMRPFLLISGPFKIVRTASGLQFGWNTNLALAGGLAACMPVKTDNLRTQLLVMTAGGPLVSLVSGLIGLLVHALWLSGSFWEFASFIFGITSLAIFVVTIFPGKTSGFMTDGAQILSMLRGGEEGEQRAVFFILQAESMQGTRPRDYTAAILARLSALKGTPLMNTSAQLIVYYHLLDRGDIQQAEQTLLSLSQHTEELPDVFKKAISLENAFFLAAHRQDATSAQSYLSAAKGALVEKHSMLRAEVAVLWAQGKMDEAQDLARQFDQLASRSIDRGSAIAEREWVQALFR